MARQVRRNWWEWCDFGDHVIKAGDGHMHVYPIPTCEAFPDGGTDAQGGTSCLACYDNVLKLQVEQGLVELREGASIPDKRGRARKSQVVVESAA